jgi:hypothetical protein
MHGDRGRHLEVRNARALPGENCFEIKDLQANLQFLHMSNRGKMQRETLQTWPQNRPDADGSPYRAGICRQEYENLA